MIPFVVTIKGVESDTRNLWVVATVVLGLLSIGLGYTQRPKTEAQACKPTCKPTVITAQENIMPTQPATVKTVKEEKTAGPIKVAKDENMEERLPPTTAMIALTQIRGIGEKRANQLKALGINSVEDLSKASAKTIAKKLKISAKIVGKWITNAKELVK